MSTTTAVEGVQFLTQSPVRVRILDLLYDAGPMQKRELKDRLDASRVTVRRNIHALEERDWIDISDRECTITVLGKLVIEDASPALETAATVERLRPFVRWFPETELAFDVRALADAAVVVSESSDPYAPVNRHIDAMERTDGFRLLLPSVGRSAMTVGRDCVLESTSDHEIVFGEQLEPTVRNRSEYSELAEEMLASGNCALFVSDRDIPFYLGLFDACVQIGVDDDGVPKALVETDASEVREWAERTYETYRTGSRPFDPKG